MKKKKKKKSEREAKQNKKKRKTRHEHYVGYSDVFVVFPFNRVVFFSLVPFRFLQSFFREPFRSRERAPHAAAVEGGRIGGGGQRASRESVTICRRAIHQGDRAHYTDSGGTRLLTPHPPPGGGGL